MHFSPPSPTLKPLSPFGDKAFATPSSSGLQHVHDYKSSHCVFPRILMFNKAVTLVVTIQLGWPPRASIHGGL